MRRGTQAAIDHGFERQDTVVPLAPQCGQKRLRGAEHFLAMVDRSDQAQQNAGPRISIKPLDRSAQQRASRCCFGAGEGRRWPSCWRQWYHLLMIDWSTCPAVERDPERVSGAWVFRGTRVPVAALFENLEDGALVSQFVDWFPGVTIEQVRAVLEHAARSALAPV